MPRRASSSAHPVWILTGLVIAVAAILGGYFIYGKVSDPFRTMTPLPVADYLQNANSLRGNHYKIDATITRSIDWSPEAGTLFAVDVSTGDVLPILVPPQFNHMNIEKGQRYFFKIEVADKGVLRAQGIKKA